MHMNARQSIMVDGRDVVPDVWDVLDRIKDFSDKVRNGEWKGVTGKPLKNVVAVGIGGSFLGPLFVHTALRCGVWVGVRVCVRVFKEQCVHCACVCMFHNFDA
jgi:glucose-6-phosphate isomerase